MKHQNMLIAGAAVLVLALAGGAYAMHNARRDALLVRSDPDALPPELRDFAVARGAALFRAAAPMQRQSVQPPPSTSATTSPISPSTAGPIPLGGGDAGGAPYGGDGL